jgi:hypothetical protein
MERERLRYPNGQIHRTQHDVRLITSNPAIHAQEAKNAIFSSEQIKKSMGEQSEPGIHVHHSVPISRFHHNRILHTPAGRSNILDAGLPLTRALCGGYLSETMDVIREGEEGVGGTGYAAEFGKEFLAFLLGQGLGNGFERGLVLFAFGCGLGDFTAYVEVNDVGFVGAFSVRREFHRKDLRMMT